MSYLNPLRLHFAGQFQSNVSTVNNDAAHYDNATFKPSYQNMQGPGMKPPNGWFNPQGDAAFRFLGCRVTSAWMHTGQVKPSDPVIGSIVGDADDRVPAKLVDLDPEQQLVSEIWGLQVRIADRNGKTLMQGEFAPTAFMDIWDRATGSATGDTIAGAMYQSVLTNLHWGDVSASAFLTALRHAASSGVLSIKFNVDGMNLDFTSPSFMCGRIVGTIGPATPAEPRFLLIGRQFMTAASQTPGNFFAPAGGINFCAAVVNSDARCIYLDLGNALTTSTPGGPTNNVGDLHLSVATPGRPAVTLGTIPATGPGGYAQDPDWYTRTAGVVALPLTEDQLKLIAGAPLSITGNKGVFISEWSSGAFVRADRFVYRLSPGEKVDVAVYAMQWGRPLAGAQVALALDSSQLQPTPDQFPFVGASPPVATPDTVMQFNPTAKTNTAGQAILTVTPGDPGKARWFNNGADFGIDGQVYGIRPAFADPSLNGGPVNQWNFISFLVWSSFSTATPPTWTDLQPIFQQYANLYPVMNRFLNLGNYDSVVANIDFLQLAFGLNEADPNSMPVTRDLSPARRATILTWLKNPLPGPVVVASRAATTAPPPDGPTPPQGGKAAAVARRLILQKV